MLRAAVEQFIDKEFKEIEGVAMETLEGHQRAIIGSMTVDEIFKDRKKFSSKVFDMASTDLFNMGIQVISYTLKDIKDEDQYMVRNKIYTYKDLVNHVPLKSKDRLFGSKIRVLDSRVVLSETGLLLAFYKESK